MNKQNSSRAQVGIGRRQLLKLASASAAVTGTSVSTGRAFAGDAEGTGEILDIVIIGGGLAGLTAARDLKRAGCESFMVLEARDRVGGRTLNHDLGNGYFSEAGGQWIGPGQTAVADLARELGVGTFPTYYQGKYVLLANGVRATVESDGTMSTDPKLRHELEEMARTVPTAAPWTAPRAAEFDAMSYGDWLASKNLSPEAQLNFSLPAQATTGVPPSRLSLLHYLSLINSASNRHEQLEGIKGGAQESRISGGSQILSIKMAEALGDRVRLSSPVSRIENWKGGPVAIHTPKGVIRARSVIVALSPSLCHQIAFEPQLPEKRREMQRRFPAYAPMRKTAHVYKKAFWRDKGLSGLMTQLNGPIQWAYDNSPEDVSFGVISAFINNGALPSDPKLAEAELSQIYAQALGEEALHPIAFYDHDWGKVDRWSLSCTAPIPPGFLTQYGDVLKPPIGQLIWAGTETADIWITTMDGAIRSGHKAALQALQAVATKRTA